MWVVKCVRWMAIALFAVSVIAWGCSWKYSFSKRWGRIFFDYESGGLEVTCFDAVITGYDRSKKEYFAYVSVEEEGFFNIDLPLWTPSALFLATIVMTFCVPPRRFGKDQCRKCGYDVTRIESSRCPECGHEIVDGNEEEAETCE